MKVMGGRKGGVRGSGVEMRQGGTGTLRYTVDRIHHVCEGMRKKNVGTW